MKIASFFKNKERQLTNLKMFAYIFWNLRKIKNLLSKMESYKNERFKNDEEDEDDIIGVN